MKNDKKLLVYILSAVFIVTVAICCTITVAAEDVDGQSNFSDESMYTTQSIFTIPAESTAKPTEFYTNPPTYVYDGETVFPGPTTTDKDGDLVTQISQADSWYQEHGQVVTTSTRSSFVSSSATTDSLEVKGENDMNSFYGLGYTTGIILFVVIAVAILFWFFKLILLFFALNFLSKAKRNTENLYREQKKTASDEKENQEVEP